MAGTRMIYQERTLEGAQLRIAKLTRALEFWLPDELPKDDEDYSRWLLHVCLLRGGTVDVCNACGQEYWQLDDGGLCHDCKTEPRIYPSSLPCSEKVAQVVKRMEAGAIHAGEYECSQCHALPGERHTHDVPVHASDCALHNAPALPVGPCNCGVTVRENEGL